MSSKCYSELVKLKTYEERLKYLEIKQKIGDETFGHDRYLNQKLYKSVDWDYIRMEIIARDLGNDLGVPGFFINDKVIYVHHIEPIIKEDLLYKMQSKVLNPENLITTSAYTHRQIHYGINKEPNTVIERRRNDTVPWKLN